jgi:hypothetical protein
VNRPRSLDKIARGLPTRLAIVTFPPHHAPMSHTVTLWCGCSVYVSCHPQTGIAHSRIVEARGSGCPVKRHEIGARVWLWELLPDPRAVDVARPETFRTVADATPPMSH